MITKNVLRERKRRHESMKQKYSELIFKKPGPEEEKALGARISEEEVSIEAIDKALNLLEAPTVHRPQRKIELEKKPIMVPVKTKSGNKKKREVHGKKDLFALE